MPSSISFGEQLRSYRRHHQLTQAELAARLGYAPSTIRKLESGLRRATPQVVTALAELFGLDPAARDALLQLARTPAPPRPPRDLAPPDALIGRTADLDRAAALLRAPGVRLVTLLGPGGVGKTRMARVLTTRLAAHFRDGAVWVALADVVDARQVPAAIALALGVRPSVRQTPLAALCAELAERRHLLVLDNFEHVRVAARLLPELLAVAPELRILVTSRVALGLGAEQRLPVAPLPAPSAAEAHDPAALRRWPATELFLTRATAVTPELELTPAAASAIGAICRRLDGLPLALELAAAYTATLPPTALADEIAAHWDLLALPHRRRPARHRTLWTMLDWSYCLLAPPAQRFLRRLSVFAGGWTLPAAVEICCDADVPAGHAPALLRTLLDHSLIYVSGGNSAEPRYAMLATVQAFARARLAEAHDDATTPARHAAYYAAVAADADATYLPEALSALRREEANLQAALRYALDADDRQRAMQVATNITKFWMNDGRLAEGRRWLEQVLARSAADSGPDLARVAGMLGGIAWRQGDTAAARRALRMSLELYIAAKDQENEAWLAINLAKVECDESRFAAARQLILRALEIFTARDDAVGLGWTHLFEGEILFREGRLAEAGAAFEASLAPFAESDRSLGTAFAYLHLGETWLARGAIERAQALLRSSLELLTRFADQSGIAAALEGLASCLLAAGTPRAAVRQAVQLLGQADQIRSTSGFALPPRSQLRVAHDLERARSLLDDPVFAAEWQLGHAARLADVVERALLQARSAHE